MSITKKSKMLSRKHIAWNSVGDLAGPCLTYLPFKHKHWCGSLPLNRMGMHTIWHTVYLFTDSGVPSNVFNWVELQNFYPACKNLTWYICVKWNERCYGHSLDINFNSLISKVIDRALSIKILFWAFPELSSHLVHQVLTESAEIECKLGSQSTVHVFVILFTPPRQTWVWQTWQTNLFQYLGLSIRPFKSLQRRGIWLRAGR